MTTQSSSWYTITSASTSSAAAAAASTTTGFPEASKFAAAGARRHRTQLDWSSSFHTGTCSARLPTAPSPMPTSCQNLLAPCLRSDLHAEQGWTGGRSGSALSPQTKRREERARREEPEGRRGGAERRKGSSGNRRRKDLVLGPTRNVHRERALDGVATGNTSRVASACCYGNGPLHPGPGQCSKDWTIQSQREPCCDRNGCGGPRYAEPSRVDSCDAIKNGYSTRHSGLRRAPFLAAGVEHGVRVAAEPSPLPDHDRMKPCRMLFCLCPGLHRCSRVKKNTPTHVHQPGQPMSQSASHTPGSGAAGAGGRGERGGADQTGNVNTNAVEAELFSSWVHSRSHRGFTRDQRTRGRAGMLLLQRSLAGTSGMRYDTEPGRWRPSESGRAGGGW